MSEILIAAALLLTPFFILCAVMRFTRTTKLPSLERALAPTKLPSLAGDKISVLERRREGLRKATTLWLESMEGGSVHIQEDLKKIMIMLEIEVATLESDIYGGDEYTGVRKNPPFSIRSHLDTNFKQRYTITCPTCAWECTTTDTTWFEQTGHCPNCNNTTK